MFLLKYRISQLPSQYLKVKNDLLLLYLKGIRGAFESKYTYHI